MPSARFAERVAAGVAHLRATDPMLDRLITRVGPCRLAPDRKRTPYEALVRAVMFQQIHGKAANAILGRFVALVPEEPFPSPAAVLALPDEALRGVGLSRQKLGYIRDIAAHAHAGTIPTTRAPFVRLADETIVERVIVARGVGRWTAEMLLIFTLGRLDVLPVDDYGVRLGYLKAAGRKRAVKPQVLRRIGAAWAPYRSIAAWYLWRAAALD
jgi:DNA-3-methyladenine glycosylase II